MADFFFTEGLDAQASGTFNFASSTMKARLIASSATPTQDDLAMNATALSTGIGTDPTLGSKTVTNDTTNNRMVLDCADLQWTGLSSGATAGWVVIYYSTGTDATSIPLIALDITNTDLTAVVTLNVIIAATGLGYIST